MLSPQLPNASLAFVQMSSESIQSLADQPSIVKSSVIHAGHPRAIVTNDSTGHFSTGSDYFRILARSAM